MSDDTYENPLEAIWNDQPLSDDPDEFLNWFRSLTKTQQVLFPTHWLCAEVYNGGFHQYFHNSTGLHAPEAIRGFQELGLSDIAEIVKQAISVFGPDFPRERDKRVESLDSFEGDDRTEWDPFSELDEVFYSAIKIPGAPDLCDDDRFTVAAKEYIKASN